MPPHGGGVKKPLRPRQLHGKEGRRIEERSQRTGAHLPTGGGSKGHIDIGLRKARGEKVGYRLQAQTDSLPNDSPNG